jgi:hypothetical protein
VLVADIAPSDASLAPDRYYLAEDARGVAQLMPGGEAAYAACVLGPVLFVCRPPSRDTVAAATSELMSL